MINKKHYIFFVHVNNMVLYKSMIKLMNNYKLKLHKIYIKYVFTI